MTLGGRKRQLSIVVDAMLGDAYPSEAMALGQWLMEMGHMIVLSEASSQEPPSIAVIDAAYDKGKIQQLDLSDIDRDIPPDKLN